jgi:hypothetical protein
MERAGLDHGHDRFDGKESWFYFILGCLIDYECLSYICL